jgi:LCP family protein required for cell wall assembly
MFNRKSSRRDPRSRRLSEPWSQTQPNPVNPPANRPSYGSQPPYPSDPYNQPPDAYPQPGDPYTSPGAYSPAPQGPTYNWPAPPDSSPRRRRSRSCGCGCLPLFVFAGLLVLVILSGYFLVPGRTNVLLLGIDYTTPGNSIARTDTIILTTIQPSEPYVGMLSIPRDLWVSIPSAGENRINTAHFFAEAQQAGSGPLATEETIRQNFGVNVDYYARIRFEGLREVVNAMGGVSVDLPKPMAGYPAGVVHLNGNNALAFARNRTGSDDFFRMDQGQILIKSMIKEIVRPRNWIHLPAIVRASLGAIETNVPVWLWPRLGLAFLRVGPDGIDNRTIHREMVAPFTTNEGASVLLPDWNQINPTLLEMFGQ